MRNKYPRPTISFEGTVPPFIPVWIALPPIADRVRPVWAELGPVETPEQHDSVLAVGLERLTELAAADNAVDDSPDGGGYVGVDEWDALRHAVVAEGIRRCAITPE